MQNEPNIAVKKIKKEVTFNREMEQFLTKQEYKSTTYIKLYRERFDNDIEKKDQFKEDGEEGEEEPDIKEYTKHIVIWLKIMAMAPIFTSDDLGVFKTLVNWLYFSFVNFVNLHVAVLSMVQLYLKIDQNILVLTKIVMNVILYATSTILLLYFQVVSKELLSILKNFDDTFRYRSAEGLTRLDMRASYKKSKVYGLSFIFACFLGSMHFTFEPLTTRREADELRQLPVEVWYPISVQETPYYEIAYFVQFLGQACIAIVYSNFVMVFLSLCVLVCGQFDLLGCSLRNLHFTALTACGVLPDRLLATAGYSLTGSTRCTLPEDEKGLYFSGEAKVMDRKLKKILETQEGEETMGVGDRNVIIEEAHRNIERSDKYIKALMGAIHDCIIHHQAILEYCDTVKRISSTMSLCKMCQITLLLCFTLLSTIEMMQYPLLDYLVLIGIDLFLMCYFGNEVMLRSQMVGVAAYGSTWEVFPPKARRCLLFLMKRSERPFILNGGSFYKLTLQNFLEVIRASFQFFTVLRTVNSY